VTVNVRSAALTMLAVLATMWGMLLAVPMMMVIKAVCDHVEDFNAFGELLGE
jgi:predicted PurR-regulated permease PerM